MAFDDYKVVLYRNQPEGWVAEIPAIPGCHALMTTREEVLAELTDVFNLIAQEYQERNEPLPDITPGSPLQSVTLPPSLAADVRRVAQERHVTMSRALVILAERGVRAEAEAKRELKAAHRRFLNEKEPGAKNQAGRDLIRSIFGKDSIAEDTVF